MFSATTGRHPGFFSWNGRTGSEVFFFLRFICMFWLLWVFIAAHCLSLVAGSGGYSLVVVRRLLIVVASLVVKHRL